MGTSRVAGADRTLMRYQEKLRQELPRLRAKFHVRTLGVFGSHVRGTATGESDLDLLVEFSHTPGLLEFIHCEQYLSDRLGVKVDLVMKETLKPRIGQRILREVVGL
jgi:predicted nucleotidyltransferase